MDMGGMNDISYRRWNGTGTTSPRWRGMSPANDFMTPPAPTSASAAAPYDFLSSFSGGGAPPPPTAPMMSLDDVVVRGYDRYGGYQSRRDALLTLTLIGRRMISVTTDIGSDLPTRRAE
jgi:hypothetical protein